MNKVINRIEAYGVRGIKSKAWRRAFVSIEAMRAWAEKNDAEVYGTRAMDEGESR